MHKKDLDAIVNAPELRVEVQPDGSCKPVMPTFDEAYRFIESNPITTAETLAEVLAKKREALREPGALTFDQWWTKTGLLGNGPMKPVALAAWNAALSSKQEPPAPTDDHLQAQIRSYQGCIEKIQAVIRSVLGKETRWQEFDVLPSGVVEAIKVGHSAPAVEGKQEPGARLSNEKVKLALDETYQFHGLSSRHIAFLTNALNALTSKQEPGAEAAPPASLGNLVTKIESRFSEREPHSGAWDEPFRVVCEVLNVNRAAAGESTEREWESWLRQEWWYNHGCAMSTEPSERAREVIDQLFAKHYSGSEAKSFRHALRRELTPLLETALTRYASEREGQAREAGQDDVLNELSDELADYMRIGLIRRGQRCAAQQKAPGERA
jgi:hypothetical protein